MATNKDFEKGAEVFLASLSYLTLGIIGIFILVSEMDDDEFLRFHAKQSIGYWAITLIFWGIFSFLFKFLFSITTKGFILNQIFFYLWKFVYVGFGFFIIIYAFYLVFSVLSGKKIEIKFITKILRKLGVKL
ncbi:MAG: hypothetical protein H5U37_01430 [Caldisericia bacterium]|nr:hypothetical protein [Caldisericia bacterium]